MAWNNPSTVRPDARVSNNRAGFNGSYTGATGVTSDDGVDHAPGPATFDANTVNVYPVPFVRLVTTHDNAPDVEHIAPPGDAITRYPVTDDPPFDNGANHDTVTSPSPATPTTDCGAPGTEIGAMGVTIDDGVDAAPGPTTFDATTVNVYPVPFTMPVTVHDNTPAVEHVAPPGDAVTTYPVIADPPSDTGADHDTDT